MSMKKKGAIICVAAAMALSAVGFGFAKWSSAVDAKVNAATGSLKLGWVQNSAFDKDDDPHNLSGDWMADQGLVNFRQLTAPENKEVGTTSLQILDQDSDGTYELLNVTVDNGYPFYYNEVSGLITATGTVPMILGEPKLIWQDQEFEIRDYTVYWLGKDGTIIQPTAEQKATPVQVGDNWVLELRWMNNADKQLHNGDVAEESFNFQVLQAADQNTTYEFGIKVEGIQWNEVR